MARTITIEQELRLPTAAIQLIRMDFSEPVNDFQSAGDAMLVDLCLTPRPAGAEARFTNHWSPVRFMPVGQTFVVPPGEVLQFRAPRGRQVALVCQLQPTAFDPWLGELDWSERRLEASLDVGARRAASLLRFLAQELRYPDFAQTAAADCIIRHLCIELARHFAAIDEPSTSGGLAEWRLKLIDERLLAPGAAPSLGDLAQLCNMSVRHLTRAFRISRGYSVGEHVAQTRMDRAKRMLAGEESIKVVAEQLGFASASSFSFAFRRATGFTPRLFRTRILRGI